MNVTNPNVLITIRCLCHRQLHISMILKIEGKADRTAKVYKYICPIFRLDKTSLNQGLEKLSENRIHGYGNVYKIIQKMSYQ